MFIINLRVLSMVITLLNYVSSVSYSVPDPKIEVFERGFRFSIPDHDGIELFAFHGNINARMRHLEAGLFSQDILSKCGRYWVFENQSEKLVAGDKIYFWLYVLKNGLGYRYDNGEFTVKETLERNSLNCADSSALTKAEFSPSICNDLGSHDPIFDVRINREKRSSVCCDLFLNVSQRLVDLEKQNKNLVEENEILYEIASKAPNYINAIRIFGKYPAKYYPTPKDFAQNFVAEKLAVENVQVKEAKIISDNGLSFEVENLNDKAKIIMAARKRLIGSNYIISW